MKKGIVVLLVVLCSFVSVNANAQVDSPLYVGGKIGLVDADEGGFDDAVNLGVMIGYELHDVLPNFSVEGELTTTIVEGDVSVGVPPFGSFDGDWNVTTLGAYGVYTVTGSGNLYGKAKAGLLYTDVEFDLDGFGSSSDDDINLSIGLGGGLKLNNGDSLELELTFLDVFDGSFLSFGYVHPF